VRYSTTIFFQSTSEAVIQSLVSRFADFSADI